MVRFFALALIVLTIGATTAHSQKKTITVFAAASLKNALDDVDAAFTNQTGVKVITSYDASSALMKQIEGGAPADAFLSADLKWMDYGVEKKVINDSTRVNLLGNVLVLIAAKDSKIDHVDIKPGFDLAKLAGEGRIATGDVKASLLGSTPRLRWRSLVCGRPSNPRWPWRSMSEPLWPTSPVARRRSALFMRPMQRSNPG